MLTSHASAVPQPRVENMERKQGHVVCAPEPWSAREFPDVAVFSDGRVRASEVDRRPRRPA
jgi:hypothetical protein